MAHLCTHMRAKNYLSAQTAAWITPCIISWNAVVFYNYYSIRLL